MVTGGPDRGRGDSPPGGRWTSTAEARDGREQDILEGSQELGCFGLKVFEQKHEKQDWRCRPGPVTGLKGCKRSHTDEHLVDIYYVPGGPRPFRPP